MDKIYNFGNNGETWSAEHRQNIADALLYYYDNSYPHFDPYGALSWIMTQNRDGDKHSPAIMYEINKCIDNCPIPFGNITIKDKIFYIKSGASKGDVYSLLPDKEEPKKIYEDKCEKVNEIINSNVFKTNKGNNSNYVKSAIAFVKVNGGDLLTNGFIYPVDINADYARIFFDIFSHNEEIVKEDLTSERTERNEQELYNISDKTSEVRLVGFAKAIVFYLFDFLLAKAIAGINKSTYNESKEINKEELNTFLDKFSSFSLQTGYYCSIFKEEFFRLKTLKLYGNESIKSFEKILEVLKSFDKEKNTILIPEYSIYLPRVFEAYSYHIIKEKYEKGNISVEYKEEWPDKEKDKDKDKDKVRVKVVFYPDIIMHLGVKRDIIIDAKCKFDYSIFGSKFNDDYLTIEKDIMQLVSYLRVPYPKEGRREFCVAYPVLRQNNKDLQELPDIDENLNDFIVFRDKDKINKRIKFLLPIRYPQSSNKWVINAKDGFPYYSLEYDSIIPQVGSFMYIKDVGRTGRLEYTSKGSIMVDCGSKGEWHYHPIGFCTRIYSKTISKIQKGVPA